MGTKNCSKVLKPNYTDNTSGLEGGLRNNVPGFLLKEEVSFSLT